MWAVAETVCPYVTTATNYAKDGMLIGVMDHNTYGIGHGSRQYHRVCYESYFDEASRRVHPVRSHSRVCEIYHFMCGSSHNPVFGVVSAEYSNLNTQERQDTLLQAIVEKRKLKYEVTCCSISTGTLSQEILVGDPQFSSSISSYALHVICWGSSNSLIRSLPLNSHSSMCQAFNVDFFISEPPQRATGLKAIVSPWKDYSVVENIGHVAGGALLGAAIVGGGGMAVMAASGTAITVGSTATTAAIGLLVGAVVIAIFKTISSLCCKNC